MVVNTIGEPFVSSDCDKGYSPPQHSQGDMLVHAEEKPYICETCGKVFKSVINLNSHRTVQTGEKSFLLYNL